MKKDPLSIIAKEDKEFYDSITDFRSSAFQEGALSKKHKYLTAMALDADHGTVNGVKTLATLAMKEGATKEEIMETLRVAYYTSGVGCMYVAAQALNEVFKDE